MSIKKKKGRDGKIKWVADFYIVEGEIGVGPIRRIRQTCPTKELAERFEQKVKIEAFEGRFFKREHADRRMTISKIWELYRGKAKLENKSFATDVSRVAHLIQHLDKVPVSSLTEMHINKYRQARSAEVTLRGMAPSPATMDRELEILQRMINWAVRAKLLRINPIACVRALNVSNTRDTTLGQVEFEKVLAAAEEPLRPIILVAYEVGMRLREILDLKWERVDLKARQFRLLAQDLKEAKPRLVLLSDRIVKALQCLPRSLDGYVFINPRTGTRWNDIHGMWRRALKGAGIQRDVHIHDLRRSFVTNARKRGIPESVVMQMSGHSTREVFARYNIVDEKDLTEAVRILERGRDEELAAKDEVAK